MKIYKLTFRNVDGTNDTVMDTKVNLVSDIESYLNIGYVLVSIQEVK